MAETLFDGPNPAPPILLEWQKRIRTTGHLGVLTETELAVLWAMMTYADNKSLECWPSYVALAADIHETNVQRVRDAIKRLVLHGLIEPLGKVAHPPFGPTRTYRLLGPSQPAIKIKRQGARRPRKSQTRKETESVSFAPSANNQKRDRIRPSQETESVSFLGRNPSFSDETESVSITPYSILTPQSNSPCRTPSTAGANVVDCVAQQASAVTPADGETFQTWTNIVCKAGEPLPVFDFKGVIIHWVNDGPGKPMRPVWVSSGWLTSGIDRYWNVEGSPPHFSWGIGADRSAWPGYAYGEMQTDPLGLTVLRVDDDRANASVAADAIRHYGLAVCRRRRPRPKL